MRGIRLLLAASMLCAGAAAAEARDSGISLQDQRQAACYTDVQKLCGQFIPNVEKVTACMKPRKHEVSAKCRKLWDVKG